MTSITQESIARANVLGVGVHAVDMEQAVAVMRSAIEEGRKGYVCLAGAHGIVEARRDPELRAVFANACLVAPDGMPAVWMGQLQGHRRMRRVFGPDLMLEIVGRRDLAGWRHFFCGGAPGVAEQLRDDLLRRFPWASIVGTYTPPFRPMTAEGAEGRELAAQADATGQTGHRVGRHQHAEARVLHGALPAHARYEVDGRSGRGVSVSHRSYS